MVEVPVKIYVTNIAKKAREAARPMALLSGVIKNKALLAMADRLEAEEEALLEANLKDVETVGKTLDREAAREAVERVRLTPDAIKAMAEGLRRVADLSDPVGEVTSMHQRPNGMQVSRVRTPIGVIGIISEFGPQVTTDSVALCLKSGNVCVFRGASEWIHTNTKLAVILREAAEGAGVPVGAITFVERPEKEAAIELLRQTLYLDAVIPRGGAGLRKTVIEQTRLPILCHDGGLSYVYIDADADLPLAQNVVVNSKAQLPMASGSVDTLLVHRSTARPLVPALVCRLLDEFKVEVRGCPKTIALAGAQSLQAYKELKAATDEDWTKQFLSSILAVKIVQDVDEALAHIARYGVVHTASIVTRDYAAAMRFTQEVDGAAVMINASTRLHDGEEFGLGCQIGISTMRTHARGPIALEQLTSQKYVILGTGQLRHPHPVPVTYEDAIMLKRPS
ncbi:MAG: glutamate-5-semialdehyde dehydrogenase [Nitrospiraceae bacterium]